MFETEIPEINGPGSQVAPAGLQAEQIIADGGPAVSSIEIRKSQLAWEGIFAVVRPLLFGAVAACLFLWVALYNGYPTVYPDTGSYLYTGAFFVAFPPFRAPGYSMFIVLTSRGASAWFTAAVQAIVVVAALYEACKYLIAGQPKFRDNCMLGIACALALLTSLPWEASLLMPDVFAGTLFLSAFLLAFDGRLHLMERIVLASILALSVSSHLSFFPIAGVFVVALGIARLAGLGTPKAKAFSTENAEGTDNTGSGRRQSPSVKSALAWLLVPILVAGLGTASLNRAMGLGFKLSVSGNEFLLGKLFGDGLAGDFLRKNCPTKPFIACRYLGNLPRTSEQFLFWHPLLHDMAGHQDEINALVRSTIAAYPLRFAARSFYETLLQIRAFHTGQEARDLALHAINSNADAIRLILPRDLQAFLNSRLMQGLLLWPSNAAAVIDAVAFWLSAAGCLFFAWTKRVERLNPFFYSAVAFLVINAAVCATVAGVYDRYQSRVAWIVPFCFMLYVCCLVGERKTAQA